MTGFRIRQLPFLTTTGGRVVGVISDGVEVYFPTFSADGTQILKPDGSVFSSGAAVAATALTLTGPTTGVVNLVSSNYSVALSPTGSTVASPVTVTPSDSAGGGAFNPTSLSLTTAAPSGSFTYTPGSTGTKSISITNNGGLTNPAALTYTSTAASGATMRQVATGTQIANIRGSASNLTAASRTPHTLMSTVSALAIVLPNWYVNGQTETNAGSATWTASIEYPSGTYTQVLFGGATSVTSNTGGNIVSDMTAVSIPKGAKFWVRLYQNTTSGVVFFNFYAGDGTAQFSSPATDSTMGGGITVCASTAAPVQCPIAIIGMSSDPAVGIYGDSISVGRGDTADTGLALQGHLGRSFGASYAAGHVGVSGDRISIFLTNNTKRMSLAGYFTHFAINMGINDITGGDSTATVASNTNSLVALFPNNAAALCTMSPVSTSTDSWATTANQTTVASNANRATENTRRIAGVPGAKVIYDVNPAVESVTSPESGIWKAPSYTADGTHPSATGYKAEVAGINVALLVP